MIPFGLKHVTISRDFILPQEKIDYNYPLALKKPPTSLPYKLSPTPIVVLGEVSLPMRNPAESLSSQISSPPGTSTATGAVPSPPPATTYQSESTHASITAPANLPKLASKHYAYIPYSAKAPKDISSSLNSWAILPARTRSAAKTSEPSANLADTEDNDDNDGAFLSKVVSVKEAFSDAYERPLWLESMAGENSSLINHNTGMLVPPPDNNIVIGGMWHLVQKKNEFGNVVRRKSQWVCCGNHQQFPRHYLNTYSSVGCTESLKSLLAIAVQRCLHVFQFNVENTFLYGNIDTTIYVAQVLGFEVPGKEKWVWKLNKSLYGTKQALRCWKSNLVTTLANLGLKPSQGDKSLFVNSNKKSYSIQVQERPVQHLGYTLDWQLDGSLLLHQHDFCLKALCKLGMDTANSVKAPAPLNLHHLVSCKSPAFDTKTMQKTVGMLIHLSINMQLDIAFTVNIQSRYANAPTEAHWNMAKLLIICLSVCLSSSLFCCLIILLILPLMLCYFIGVLLVFSILPSSYSRASIVVVSGHAMSYPTCCGAITDPIWVFEACSVNLKLAPTNTTNTSSREI